MASRSACNSILVADLGQLMLLGRMKKTGDLPPDFVLKTSVTLAAPNPAAARLLEDLGATSLNLPVDLTLPQIAAIRQAVDVAIDFYIESPDDFGGGVRYYEIPEMVRVAAPIYLKYGIRNSPPLYPAGQHLEATVLALSRERVRRAAIGMGILRRYAPEAVASPMAGQHPPVTGAFPPDQGSSSSTSTSHSGPCARWRASASRSFRRDARPDGRERGRQVDAPQDSRRHRHAG